MKIRDTVDRAGSTLGVCFPTSGRRGMTPRGWGSCDSGRGSLVLVSVGVLALSERSSLAVIC